MWSTFWAACGRGNPGETICSMWECWRACSWLGSSFRGDCSAGSDDKPEHPVPQPMAEPRLKQAVRRRLLDGEGEEVPRGEHTDPAPCARQACCLTPQPPQAG